MSPRKTILIAVALFLCASGLVAEPELSIRFFDKRIYFPETEITIKVTISNDTPQTYRFKLAEDRVHSLSFEARTPTNRLLEPSDAYRKALADNRPAYYREMSLEPGEEYSFIERVEKFVKIEGPGTYALRAAFWPELIGQSSAKLSSIPLFSNTLVLSVRPSAGLPPASEIIKQATGEALRPESIAPDEVVKRTLIARQRSRWNEFFLYLDLESLLSRNEDRKHAYDRESDEGRRMMIERFKADLKESVTDTDISMIPLEYSIIETRYTESLGFVRVLEKFDNKTFKLVKEYIYELGRRDDIWYIVGYTVQNKGTE